MAHISTSISLLPSFDDPISDSQYVFKSLLKSMSEPGIVGDIPDTARQQSLDGSSIYSTSWSIARAFFDHDTVIYVSPTLHSENLIRSIKFQTDARITDRQEGADFALITLAELNSDNNFKVGTIERPHESCTVIIQVEAVDKADLQIEISGPGIESTRTLGIDGLKTEQITLIKNNHKLYPCGLDFVFCSPQAFIALPRTTAVNTINQTTGDAVCM